MLISGVSWVNSIIILFDLGPVGVEDVRVELVNISLLYQIIMILIVCVPDLHKVLFQKLTLFHASDVSDTSQEITCCDVCLVFSQYSAAVCFTESRKIFVYCLFDIFLIVPSFLFLLNKAHLLLFFFFLCSLLCFFLKLLLVCFFLFFLLNFIKFCLLLLLCVFWAIHPSDMWFSLVVLVH